MNKAQWYLKLTAENFKHRNPFATIQQETLKEKKKKHLFIQSIWF